jgi:ABC transport system ATP-binding/permease protein
MPLIHLKDVALAFGTRPLLDHVECVIEAGERIGLIGRNGEGKSSLLKILAKELEPESGTVARLQGLTWATARQEPEFDADATTFAIVASGIVDFDHGSESHRVEAVLASLGIPIDARFGSLSGGQQKRVQLAAALVGDPQLLLLDEPTNHLDLAGIAELEDRLMRFRGGAVVVSHDRAFLDRVCTRMIELDRGRLASFQGNFGYYRVKKAEQLEREAAANARLDKLLAQEEVWVRRGIEARRTRDQGRVRRLEALRKARAERRSRLGGVRFALDVGERTGKLVCELREAGFARGSRPIVPAFSATVTRGDKIGIIGPNGIGKTTLVKLIVGELEPTTGSIHRPAYTENVTRVAYLDQSRAFLRDDQILADVISPGSDYVEVDGARRHIISYLEDFLFPAERARAKVGALSGGERARLLLARMFARPANVLVLDEPTNDLDIETIELLEAMLQEYEGTVILVSHDRALLNNVATQSFVFDDDGVVREYPGGYDDWQSQRAALVRDLPATVAGSAPLPPETPGREAKVERPARERRAKLSFNEARDLEQLPDRIAALEAEQASVEKQLGDGAALLGDAKKAATLGERHAALAIELEAAYTRWTELEDKRASLA